MVCGPKCSAFIVFVSLWGTIFLIIVGGLFFNESVGLLEDLPSEGKENKAKPWSDRRSHIKDLYRQNALNSWIAAAINAGVCCAAIVRLRLLR